MRDPTEDYYLSRVDQTGTEPEQEEAVPKTYQENDYLGSYICPICQDVDCLYYEECPACDENFVRCGHCSYKSAMKDCDAVMADE